MFWSTLVYITTLSYPHGIMSILKYHPSGSDPTGITQTIGLPCHYPLSPAIESTGWAWSSEDGSPESITIVTGVERMACTLADHEHFFELLM